MAAATRGLVAARKFGRRYPWENWLARRELTLIRGRDFDCLTHGMVGMVRNRARSEKIKVSVRVLDEDSIHVRFHR